jgi:hypothetical protein
MVCLSDFPNQFWHRSFIRQAALGWRRVYGRCVRRLRSLDGSLQDRTHEHDLAGRHCSHCTVLWHGNRFVALGKELELA